MKRLRWIIFNGLTTLSLALCVTTVVVLIARPSWWVIGYPDFVLWGVFATASVPLVLRKNKDKSRRLFTILSIISLILLFVACWELRDGGGIHLWNRTDRLDWPNSGFDARPPEFTTTHIRIRSFAFVRFVEIHGCFYYARTIELPAWLTIGLLSVMPFLWLRVLGHEWYRRHQERLNVIAADNNRCISCGYDLRATPERCPECGTLAAAATGETTA